LRNVLGQAPVVLPGERVVGVGQRQFLEGRRRLGIDDVHQRAVGQIGQRDLRHLDPEVLGGLPARHGPRRSRPRRMPRADSPASAPRSRLWSKGTARDGPRSPISPPLSADSTMRGVLDRAADRTDLVERPAERHAARPTDPAEGGPQPRGAAALRRRGDRAQRLGPDRKSAQAPQPWPRPSPRSTRLSPRSGSTGCGSAAVPDVVIGQRAHAWSCPEARRPPRSRRGDDPHRCPGRGPGTARRPSPSRCPWCRTGPSDHKECRAAARARHRRQEAVHRRGLGARQVGVTVAKHSSFGFSPRSARGRSRSAGGW
jgi:hypothetical protein